MAVLHNTKGQLRRQVALAANTKEFSVLAMHDNDSIAVSGMAKKMKNYSHQESSELRKTLEYAEAVLLIGQQCELDRHRGSIKEQLNALKRLSRAAVEVARRDILSKN